MKILGLCGGSGSGKGVVSSFFNDLGIKSIDTDKVYHSIISENGACTEELVEAFGEQIRAERGVDRNVLRDIVFSSEEKRLILNRIAHKHILASVRNRIAELSESGEKGVIIDAPLLFESGFDKECDATICVISDESYRIDRIIKRDSLTRDTAIKRIKTQISNDDLKKMCTYCICNNGTKEDLYDSVFELNKIIFD